MSSHTPSVTFADVAFRWPDGTPALTAISGSFGAGRTGLVGANGSGKSTLLRLAAGLLTPTSGRITTAGEVGYLPQTLPLQRSRVVADLLGIGEKLAALRAIEGGSLDGTHYDVLGDDWDLETRAAESLRRIGLPVAALDRAVGTLSGGEAMLVAITGLRLRRTPVTLLDEPTNSLDRAARSAFRELVDGWVGALVVVSHDRALLEHMDDTAELHAGRLTVFGGPYSAWRAAQEEERAAAAQAVRTAQQTVQVERRQRIEAETRIAHSSRAGRKLRENRSAPKIVLGAMQRAAEVSAGKQRTLLDERLQSARAALDEAEERLRDDEHIVLDLPDPGVARGRRLAELHGVARSFVIQGPERVVLRGPNGAGKTSLLEGLLAGTVAETRPGGRLLTERVGYLPQRLDTLDEALSTLENVRAAAPAVPPGEIRNRLARLLLRGDAVHRAVSSLSGGERFRACLARLLLADPPVQLLILDEPTNSLDLASVDQLVEALAGYRGAVLVVTHDDEFARSISPDLLLDLTPEGDLTEARL